MPKDCIGIWECYIRPHPVLKVRRPNCTAFWAHFYISQTEGQLKADSNQEKIGGFQKTRFIFPDFTKFCQRPPCWHETAGQCGAL